MNREPVVSSNLSEVGYDASSRTFEILFHSGAVYLFFFVPEEVHHGLMRAESLETYHSRHIKHVYEHRRIAEPHDQPRDPKRKKRK
jgi:hypothetical protein